MVDAQSYWQATADGTHSFPALREDIETDVAVVGAGFTGLAATYQLLRDGRDCVVLDAHQPGWGASGRNGGMTVPRYKYTYAELAAHYGLETALEMYRLAHAAVDLVERTASELELTCDFGRYGHIAPDVHEKGEKRFAADVEWLAREAGDTRPRMLPKDELSRRIGSDFYRFGFFDPRGGGVHPLRYCQGLAQSLASRSVRLFGDTPVRSWKADAQEVLLEAGGVRVRAKHLLLATNGYTDLTPVGDQLKRRILSMQSSVVATEPLSDKLRARILPEGNLVTDVKRLTNYFRIMPDGRFLFGGRGGASNRESMGAYVRLQKELGRIFPPLADLSIEFRWSGRVAVTMDGLPRIGSLGSRVLYALGYNGRGVALANYLGAALARRLAGEDVVAGPIASGSFEPIPFYALRVPAKRVGIQYYRLLDAIGA